MRVKVSETGCLYWHDGQLVWDDGIRHEKLALTNLSEVVLRWFATWRELSTAADLGAQALRVAERLVDRGLLIAEGTPQHQLEQRVLDRWRAWGPAARQYHFASRTLTSTAFYTFAEDDERLRVKGRQDPAPPAFKSYPDRELVPIPPGPVKDDDWPYRGLVQSLYRRRTVREYRDEPIALSDLASLLQIVGGVVGRFDDPYTGTSLFRTSPFAGARHAIEMYVYARRVDGLAPGIYHFAADRCGLEVLRVPCSQEEVDAVAGHQTWAADCSATIFYTAVLERLQWKYEMPRSYRDVMTGLGHYSQTAFLTATAMGLGMAFITAIRDEAAERLLGCDGSEEIVLATAMLGHPAG